MENLKIEATKYTPEIEMNKDTGIVSLVGKSYPENTFEFYEPVMKWLEDYFDGNAQEETVINFEIIYFNSSSSKLLFDLFDLIEEMNDKSDIKINWFYDSENESALEAGEDFKEDFEDLNIYLVSK
ncbi:MAG: DUF1987 domain-containing protein [Arcobacteraceae bacterium]